MSSRAPQSASNSRLAGAWCLVFAMLIAAAGVALEYPRLGETFALSKVYFPATTNTETSGGEPAATASVRRVFFPDPDDYTHVYRAKRLLAGDSARLGHMAEINYPDGVELHWTVVMDYLLAGAGILAMPLTDHPDPIGVAAAWLPVVLGVLYVLCAIGWVRRGVGWGPALLVGLFVVLSPAFHRAFQLGHPDHHALLELLFVVAVGAWMTPTQGDGEPSAPTRRAAVISGLATGLAIWVSSQSLLVWAAILVGVSYACMQTPMPVRKRYLAARLAWNVCVGVVVVVAMVIENWPDLTVATIDKVSLIHLALVAMAFLAPGAMPHREEKGSVDDEARETAATAGKVVAKVDPTEQRGTTRTIAMLAALAAFIIWMGADADRVLEPVSRPEVSRWHELVAELQPLYTHVGPQWSLTPMHRQLGYLPYALPLLLPLFLMSRRVGPAIKCTLGLLAPTLAALSILQLRWLDHYNLAVMPVAVIGLWEGLARVFSRSAGLRPVLRLSLVGIVLGLLTYPASARIIGRQSRQQLASAAAGAQSPEQALDQQLVLDRTDFVAQSINHHAAQAGVLDPDHVSILCEEGEGPMLLYETGLPVVAAPYHRAIDGIVEVATFFAQRDPAAAREQLDRLRVRYVVTPARFHEQLMNLEHIAFAEQRSFEILRESIDADGKPHRELAAKPQVADTMIFRMVMRPDEPCIPGVKLIGRIRAEDPTAPVQMRGLLYVVESLEPEE